VEVALKDFCQPEVGHLRELTAARAVDEHIRRLGVAVDDVLRVHVAQREDDVLQQAAAPVEAEAVARLAVERVGKCLARDVLEHRERKAHGLVRPGHADFRLGMVVIPHDMRVGRWLLRHRSQDGGLALKPCERVSRGNVRTQHLHHDVDASVPGRAEDPPLPPFADAIRDGIASGVAPGQHLPGQGIAQSDDALLFLCNEHDHPEAERS
jgi:hypothetical protein